MNEIGIKKVLFLHDIRVDISLLIIKRNQPETVNRKHFLRDVFDNMGPDNLGGPKRQFAPDFNLFLLFGVYLAEVRNFIDSVQEILIG